MRINWKDPNIEKIKRNINNINPALEVIGINDSKYGYIIVNDKYGEYSVAYSNILKSTLTSIESAIDKNSYFVNKAIEVHGDKYNYSRVDYKNAKSKVSIICEIHGCFMQRPCNHTSGKGCPKCGSLCGPPNLTTDDFVKSANKIHGGIYDYSGTKYIGSKIKVDIVCKIHGIFSQTPNGHLDGKGCKKCANDNNTWKYGVWKKLEISQEILIILKYTPLSVMISTSRL